MLKSAIYISAVFLHALALVDTSSAEWKGIQPEGGNIERLAVNPADPARVYALNDVGLFYTTDAGEGWHTGLSFSSQTGEVVPDPGEALSALAIIDQRLLFRTADGGASWKRVATGLPNGEGFSSIVASPDEPTTWLATSVSSRVYRSTDGGVTWLQDGVGLPQDGSKKLILAVSQRRRGRFYAADSSRAIYESADSGRTWRHVGAGPSVTARQLLVDPQDPRTLYLSGDRDLMKSSDMGATWTSIWPWAGRRIWWCTTAPGKGGVSRILVGTTSPEWQSSIQESPDGGLTRHQLIRIPLYYGINDAVMAGRSRETALVATAVSGVLKREHEGAWLESNRGLHAVEVRSMIVDSTLSRRYLACGFGGIYESRDAGSSWVRVFEEDSIDELHQDVNDPSVLYASGWYVWRSTDGGRTWQISMGGLYRDSDWAMDFESLPSQPGVVVASIWYYGVDSDRSANRGGASPIPQSTGGGFVGLYKSRDYGRNWELLPAGQYDVYSIEADPGRPDTFYTWGYSGIERTTNGGVSFEKITGWLDPTRNRIGAYLVDPTTSDRLYASVYARDGGGGGVYSSVDGGKSWNRFSNGLGSERVYSFAVDPHGGGDVYAGAQRGLKLRESGSGVWRTAPVPFGGTVDEILFHTHDSRSMILRSGERVFRLVAD